MGEFLTLMGTVLVAIFVFGWIMSGVEKVNNWHNAHLEKDHTKKRLEISRRAMKEGQTLHAVLEAVALDLEMRGCPEDTAKEELKQITLAWRGLEIDDNLAQSEQAAPRQEETPAPPPETGPVTSADKERMQRAISLVYEAKGRGRTRTQFHEELVGTLASSGAPHPEEWMEFFMNAWDAVEAQQHDGLKPMPSEAEEYDELEPLP